MPDPNFPNRTLAVMDNLEFLRSLDNECIDLIAIDPPFAANETFEGKVKPPITDAERRAEFTLAASHGEDALESYREEDAQLTSVKDKWFFRDLDENWKKALRDAGDRVLVDLGKGDKPSARDRTLDAMREVIEAVTAVATENEAAYIAEMSVRLLECHRVLRPTGSIYLHCDHHANSYLRMLMDAIFGHKNFRNQITWCYNKWSNTASYWQRNSDTILFYAKSEKSTFNKQIGEMTSSMKQIRARGYNGGSNKSGRRILRVYDRENPKAIAQVNSGKYDDIYYINDPADGAPIPDWWNIPILGGGNKERTGYATQKPTDLYRRIVRASSNPGDTVLDLFAGCATTVIAAELEGRQWLACDMAYRASTMMMRRFYQNGHQLKGMDVDIVRDAIGEHQIEFEHDGEDGGRIIGPPDIADYPRRTEDRDSLIPSATAKRAPISTSWTGRIPKDHAKEMLLAEFGPVCWGCNFNATRPNGSINMAQLEVDHIQARKSADGVKGDDELYNLAILCAYCNKVKGNRLTLAETREKNAHDGVLYNCETIHDLTPHPHIAQQFAHKKMDEYQACL